MAVNRQIMRLRLKQVFRTFDKYCQSPRSSHHRCCSSSPRPSVHASPRSGLADEALDIRASGLAPGQSVVLQAEVDTECGRYRFKSTAKYAANEHGEVTVATQPSLGGTYTGVHPMGLLWSAAPRKQDLHKYPRLDKLDPTRPWTYTLSLMEEDGDDGDVDIDDRHRVLDSIEVERHYLPSYVDMIQIERGQLKGTLYIPQKEVSSASVPLIIDMAGLGPSPPNERGALLASHGFGVFRFDYFHSLKESLRNPNKATYFDCRLFHDIVDFAKEHPRLDEHRIAMNGSCFGGCLAVNIVSRIPDLPIRCMVLQRSGDSLFEFVGLRLPDGSLVKTDDNLKGDVFRFETKADGSRWIFEKHHHIYDFDYNADYVAPAEHISIPVSLIICGDDQCVHTERSLIRVASRMMRAGRSHLIDMTYLEGAGHLLETPYIPHCKQSKFYLGHYTANQTTYFTWGGDSILHQHGQVTAWKETINFFRRHLGPLTMCREDWVD